MLIILLIALFQFIFSSDFYLRHQRYAHPLPSTPKRFDLPFYLLSEPTNLPSNFKNYNTITENEVGTPTQNESSIAVNPRNPKNLIAAAVDYRSNSDRWVYISDDGGKTWSNKNLGKVPQGWSSSNDPSVAFNADGWGYLMYGAFAGVSASNGVFISITKDEGKTWETHIPVILHTKDFTPDSAFEDKYYVEVDESPSSPYKNWVYTPWKRVTERDSATQIVFTRSKDKGYTWEEPIPISPRKPYSSEDTTYGQSFPLLTTGKLGEIFAVWNDGIQHGVGFNRSLDGGSSWAEPRIIQTYNIFGETKKLPNNGWRHSLKGGVRAEAYPVIKADWSESPHSGNLYLSWTADNPPNVYFSFSKDKGDSWSTPVIVHKDTTNDQFWHWMDIDPLNGDLAIMYLDSRNDEGNIWTEAWVSYSNDGGLTWFDKQVSDFKSDLRRNPFGGEFAGDYSGLAFYDGKMYPSWVDMRNVPIPLGADNDVFTAVVDINAPKPLKSFSASVDSANPFRSTLKFLPDLKNAFFETDLNPSDMQIVIERDEKVIAVLAPGEGEYIDNDLTPFQKYYYTAYQVYKGKNSSPKSDSIVAGGNEKPLPPELILTKYGEELDVNDFTFRLPLYRADSTTPIFRITKFDVYVKDSLVRSFTEGLIPGENITFKVLRDVPGFYDYYFQIETEFENGLKTSSDKIYKMLWLGYDIQLANNFDDDIEFAKNRISGNFERTDKFFFSSPYSLTESKEGNYKPNQNDTIYLKPFEGVGLTSQSISGPLDFSFYTAGLIRNGDYGKFEYSYDFNEWFSGIEINQNLYPEWQDGTLNQDDWKKISVYIEQNALQKYIFTRFIFYSNAISNGDGWYLDNINWIGTSVDGSQTFQVLLYPNPASSELKINFSTPFEVFDMIGNPLLRGYYNSSESIDISGLSSGTYLLKTKYGYKKIIKH